MKYRLLLIQSSKVLNYEETITQRKSSLWSKLHASYRMDMDKKNSLSNRPIRITVVLVVAVADLYFKIVRRLTIVERHERADEAGGDHYWIIEEVSKVNKYHQKCRRKRKVSSITGTTHITYVCNVVLE